MPSLYDITEALKAPIRLVRALFIRPTPEGIETFGDIVHEYGQALRHTPSIFMTLAFKTRTLEEELHEAMLRGSLRRTLSWFNLLMIGLGVVIGTGVFTMTGAVQARFAGSATFLSYFIIGLVVLMASSCYGELCCQYPVAGSAFTYTMVTFGEFFAFVACWALLVQYILGMGAVARGFSNYVAMLFPDLTPSELKTPIGSNELDFLAFGITIIISLILSYGVRESSSFLTIFTLLKMFLMVFIVIASFSKADTSNFVDNFLNVKDPKIEGLFQGSAFLLFTAIGFDAICNAVEEARKPADIPNALLGTVGLSSFFYILLAISSAFLVSPQQLWLCSREDFLISESECNDPEVLAKINVKNLNRVVPYAPDSDAPVPDGFCPSYFNETGNQLGVYGWSFAPLNFSFSCRGMVWMQYVVSVTVLLASSSTLLVGLYSVARLVMSVAREWLVPPFLAQISPRFGTPVIAQLTVGIIIALVSLFVSFVVLADLSSFAAIITMIFVANIVLYLRYFPGVKLKFTSYGTVEAATKLPSRTEQSMTTNPSLTMPNQESRYASSILFLGNASSPTEFLGFKYQKEGINVDITDNNSSFTSKQSFLSTFVSNLRLQKEKTIRRAAFIHLFLINAFAWTSVIIYRARFTYAEYDPYDGDQMFLGVVRDYWFLLPLGLSLGALCSMAVLCPLDYVPSSWHIHGWLLPWIPGLTIICLTMGMASFDFEIYEYAFYILAFILVIYILYAMPSSYIRRFKLGSETENEIE